MLDDFPAAHSMDTTWFAVDRDGRVGRFHSTENGHVPDAAGDPEDEVWDLLYDERHLAGQGLFVFSYADESELADPYVKNREPERPLHVDQLPPQIRDQCRRVQFPVSFAEVTLVQPCEHGECSFWGDPAGYRSADGKTVRPFPGREAECREALEGYREEDPEGAADWHLEGEPPAGEGEWGRLPRRTERGRDMSNPPTPNGGGARPGLKTPLLVASLIAALGGLLFGFDTAVISGTTDALKGEYGLGSFALGFTVASALIGTILGSITAGRPADIWSRRVVLFAIAVLYFVSAVGSALAPEWYSFLFFRFIGGVGVGGASVVAPMYIAEIAPARFRGRLVAVTQFNIVLGILLAYFSNYLIAQLDLGEITWRWMFGVEAFPAAAFFLLLFLTPYSPRWLVAQGRPDEAREVLGKVGTDTGDVGQEIEEIQRSLDLAHHSLREPFFRRAYLQPILLAVAIAAFNQLSGINALMYYAPHIFRMAGAAEGSALLQAVAVGGTNLAFTMLALLIIDNFGRRKLMLVGSIGYILSLGATAAAFYTYGAEFRTVGAVVEAREAVKEAATPQARAEAEQVLAEAESAADRAASAASTGGTVVLISLLVFIASHAFGQGAVIWVFISEIFPNRVRARGQALGSFTHWFMAAVISWTFPVIADWSGGHTFAFYAGMMVLQLCWVLLVMPETKGVPLEQIQKKLGIE